MGTIEGTIGQLFPEADLVPAAGVNSGTGGIIGWINPAAQSASPESAAVGIIADVVSSGSGASSSADTGLPGEMHMFEYMFASLTQSLQQLLVQNTSSQSGASGANTLPATAS